MNFDLTNEQLDLIRAILQRGHRAELIPVKNGVKIIEIKRTEPKPNIPRP